MSIIDTIFQRRRVSVFGCVGSACVRRRRRRPSASDSLATGAVRSSAAAGPPRYVRNRKRCVPICGRKTATGRKCAPGPLWITNKGACKLNIVEFRAWICFWFCWNCALLTNCFIALFMQFKSAVSSKQK